MAGRMINTGNLINKTEDKEQNARQDSRPFRKRSSSLQLYKETLDAHLSIQRYTVGGNIRFAALYVDRGSPAGHSVPVRTAQGTGEADSGLRPSEPVR